MCKKFLKKLSEMSCKVCFSSYLSTGFYKLDGIDSVWLGAPVTPDHLPVSFSPGPGFCHTTHWMILTTCIPAGATHHFLFMNLMNLLDPPRWSLAGTLFREKGAPEYPGYPIPLRLSQTQHLAVRGWTCNLAVPADRKEWLLVLSPLVLEYRTAR